MPVFRDGSTRKARNGCRSRSRRCRAAGGPRHAWLPDGLTAAATKSCRRDLYAVDCVDGPLADLLVHLVISHHGSGRPLVPPVPDQTADQVHAQIDDTAVTAPADLSMIDWSQPARFAQLNDRFGPWGLALLEAIVRRADHAVSAGARITELEVR